MPLRTHYKVVIVGAGPAGLTAAIYASRANLEALVVEGIQPGGQLTATAGAEIVVATVVDVDVSKRPFPLTLESAGAITADSVIVASGASAKYLGLESEKNLLGYGVSACATCDGFFFRGKDVVVVGGGDTAMEEASFLTKFCTKVHLVHRRSEFRASKIMVQRALQNPKIEGHFDTVVEEILGEPATGVKGVRLKNAKTGGVRTLNVSGYFAAIGHQPNTGLFRGKLDMDDVGYLKIRHPSTKTSVPGIFAAGDVADFIYRQAVSAAGEGCKAAIDAERWLAEHGIR